MRSQLDYQSELRPKVVRCGKEEMGVSLVHLVLMVFIYIVIYLLSQKIGYIFLIINFSIFTLLIIRIRNSGPIHLDIVFLFFLFIYSFSVPISNALSEKQYDQVTLRYAADICWLAYFGFAVGLMLDTGRHRKIAKWNLLGQVEAERMRKAGMVVFFLGVLASGAAIALTSGFSTYLSAGYAGRALLKRQVGPVELGLYVSIVGLFAIFAAVNLADKSSKISRFFVYFVFIFFFFYISFLGIRRPLFLLALGLLSSYSLIRHRPKLVVALPIGIVAFAFLTTFAQYRQLISSVGINDTLAFIQANASAQWFDVSNTELGAPFRTLIDYIGNSQYRPSLLLGSSYIESFLYVFPSFITGGMESLSVQYTNRFFSSDFISIGGNMGLFPVTEAYLNFGAVGTFAIFASLGFVMSKANRWFHAVGRVKAVHVIFFMMLVPWTAFFMRLDMASFAKGFLYSQLVPFFMLVILTDLQKFGFPRRQ